MKTQTKCFERWVGQTVWRSENPVVGPFMDRVIGIKRGTITRIYTEPQNRERVLHSVEWAAAFDGYTGEPITENMKPHQQFYNAVFDYGMATLFELDILVRGGLISCKHPTGCFNEPQTEGLKEMLPLYQAVIDNPEAPYILWPLNREPKMAEKPVIPDWRKERV